MTTNATLYNESVMNEDDTAEIETPIPVTADKASFVSDATEIAKEDISYPVFKIGQGITPEVADGIAQIGQVYLTSLGKSIGKSINVIPLRYRKGQIEDQKTKVMVDYYCFQFYLPEYDIVAESYFRKSNAKAAKDILGTLVRVGFGNQQFTLTVSQKKNKGGSYFVFDVAAIDSDPETIEIAQQYKD